MEGLAPLVATKARSGCSALGVVWVHDGVTRVTAVAKVTLGLQAEGLARPRRPASLVPDALESPPGYLRTAGDLAPLLPKADILVVGFAPSPSSGAVSARARLGYWRGSQILVDKNVALLPPKPGQRVPVHGLGPLRARSRERMRWLHGHKLPTLGSSALMLPVEIDPAFVNSAPRDQQIDEIRGGDGLLLDGLVDGAPRVAMNLPDLRGFATLTAASQPNTQGTEFGLRADTLVVDLDRGVCHVVLRGDVPLQGDPRDYGLVTGVRLVAPAAPVTADPSATDKPAAKREPQATVNLEAKPDHLKALGAIAQPTPAGQAPDPKAQLFETIALSRPPAALAAAHVALHDSGAAEAANDRETARQSQPPAPSPEALAAARETSIAADQNLLGTAEISAEDVARLVAQQATPFGDGEAPSPRRAAHSSMPPATPFDRPAAAQGGGASSPSSIPPAPLPPTGVRPAGADANLLSTAEVDAREIDRLLAQRATPFEGQAPRSQPPPAPSSIPPAPAPSPASRPPERRTAELEALDARHVHARPATPFARRAAPATPAVTPSSSPPRPAVDAATQRRRNIPGLGATATVEDSDQPLLDARPATPFTGRRAHATPASPELQPAPPTTTAVAGRSSSTPRRGATATVEDPELLQARAQPATPFEAARTPAQPPPPPAQPSPFMPAPAVPAIVHAPTPAPAAMPAPPPIAAPEPPLERPDGFGAAFLEALAEV